MSIEHHFSIDGDLTIAQAGQWRSAMLQAVNDGVTRFDLSRVQEIDSAGLQLLIAARESLRRASAKLVLADVSEPVRELIERYGLGELLGPVQSESAVHE